MFFKQKTAYDMRTSDWSSDGCSSDLPSRRGRSARSLRIASLAPATGRSGTLFHVAMYKSCALVGPAGSASAAHKISSKGGKGGVTMLGGASIAKQSRMRRSSAASARRSEEQTSELQSLMRISSD